MVDATGDDSGIYQVNSTCYTSESRLTPELSPASMKNSGRAQVSSTQTGLLSHVRTIAGNSKIKVQSSHVQTKNWLPFTFQWYFLLLPTLSSLAFGIALLILVFYPRRHEGIGPDNGSSAILFGWRFSPTLLAVLYTQLTVILFEDAKRTKPFARLARAPIERTNAHGTVFQTPRAWWSVFFDILFKRKSIGKTSWCLICCALVNILAILAISPLSSALLLSQEVAVTRSIEFHKIVPKSSVQLPMLANRETYFKASVEYRDRDILLLGTPWTKPAPPQSGLPIPMATNETGPLPFEYNAGPEIGYEHSSTFRMKAFLCESQYSMKTQNITASIAFGEQPMIKHSADGNTSLVPVTDTLIDISKFQAMTIQDGWREYFNWRAVLSEIPKASGPFKNTEADQKVLPSTPQFIGLGTVLATLFSFNVSSMMSDEHFVRQVARAKGRFFTECIHEILNNPNVVEARAVKGETTVIEDRIIVLHGIGITLAFLFLVSFFLLMFIFGSSRLRWRPLNLQTDPGSTIGQAILLPSQLASRSRFCSMHKATRSEFQDALRSDKYSNINGILQIGSGGNHTGELKFLFATMASFLHD